MAILYSEALAILEASAKHIASTRHTSDRIPARSALGRIVSQDVFSLVQTPAADTSAMDGYAVQSASTLHASPETPFVMRVEGIVAAGDSSVKTFGNQNCTSKRRRTDGEWMDSHGEFTPCVEIMTGARFPALYVEGGTTWNFDACVRLEDVQLLPLIPPDQSQLVQIVKPVKARQNRRSAGEDFAEGDAVMRRRQAIGPQHVMALASLGIANVEVFRTLKVAIVSTGNEIVSPDASAADFHVRDANSPFLEMALQSLGIETRNWGVIGDDASRFVDIVKSKLDSEDIDIVVTTGAVSCGRYDFVEEGLAKLGGQTRFHRVAVRPGHPILFGDLPAGDQRCAFFGLPDGTGDHAALPSASFDPTDFVERSHDILRRNNLCALAS
ncbi:hypothetical protein LTR62_002324 [Meristemomyces frigidus]|uniref:molybdopterin adenylyltransferase n=1 Tax=Meristemomyces frigidus TaxID=1508187 RepID=A0AAN7YKQ4_9PEZI|nr:hypothetical protein LTR62_002324 [Meristemomyces frigidus]